MSNTIKLPTIIWGIAALAMFPFYLPNGYNAHLFGFQLLLALLGIGLAFRNYRATPASPPTTGSRIKMAGHVLGGLVMCFFAFGAAVATGRIDPRALAVSSPKIEGKYRSSEGGALTEFLSDGTLLFTSGGKQGVWSWQRMEDGRLKLTPDAGMLGTQAALCDYQLQSSGMTLSGCHLAMTLTRL